VDPEYDLLTGCRVRLHDEQVVFAQAYHPSHLDASRTKHRCAWDTVNLSPVATQVKEEAACKLRQPRVG